MARVSIGVPTYNGAEYIGECLACLRDQTFEDFEVFISDNGSTDGTSDICAAFAKADTRFKHVFYRETVPPTENFIRARDNTSAPYFCWRADDDLADPDWLEGLVAALDGTPHASLAASAVLRVNMTDGKQRLFDLPPSLPEDRVQRICAILLACHPSWFYGLWRRPATDIAMGQLPNYPFAWASDHLAMLPAILDDGVVLSRKGRFIQQIVRQAAYHLQPVERLAARRAYMGIAQELVAEGEWTKAQRKQIDRALSRHVENRVAPVFKMYRRAIKQKIRTILLSR